MTVFAIGNQGDAGGAERPVTAWPWPHSGRDLLRTFQRHKRKAARTFNLSGQHSAVQLLHVGRGHVLNIAEETTDPIVVGLLVGNLLVLQMFGRPVDDVLDVSLPLFFLEQQPCTYLLLDCDFALRRCIGGPEMRHGPGHGFGFGRQCMCPAFRQNGLGLGFLLCSIRCQHGTGNTANAAGGIVHQFFKCLEPARFTLRSIGAAFPRGVPGAVAPSLRRRSRSFFQNASRPHSLGPVRAGCRPRSCPARRPPRAVGA